MRKHYEAPDVIELGLAEDVVLGMKQSIAPDNAIEGELEENAELVDRDE